MLEFIFTLLLWIAVVLGTLWYYGSPIPWFNKGDQPEVNLGELGTFKRWNWMYLNREHPTWFGLLTRTIDDDDDFDGYAF